MQQLKEHIGSTQFLARLLKAESIILCVNLICGLFFGWKLLGMPIIFVLFGLAVYRLQVLSGLKDGSVAATWWYCVTGFLFILRQGFIVALHFGLPYGSFAIAKDMVSPFALLILIIVILVRAAGVARTFLDLDSGARLTASAVMGIGTVGSIAGIGLVIIAAALETVFYGFQIKFH